MIFVSGFIGYLALQKKAYVIYAHLFVEGLERSNKSVNELTSYPSIKKLHDDIFQKKERDLRLRLVTALLDINQKLSLGGELKKLLLKFKTASNPELDLVLLHEFQETLKLLPATSWNIPRQYYYFAANSLCVSYDELKNLQSLRTLFIQRALPLESSLQSKAQAQVSQPIQPVH
jgi:hypothetical protein